MTGLAGVFVGGGAAIGVGAGEGVYIGSTTTRYIGTNKDGGVSSGTAVSVSSGHITGGLIGYGWVGGVILGDVEDLDGKGFSVGGDLLGVSVEVLLDENNNVVAVQFGAGGRGTGVAGFGLGTQTVLFPDEAPGLPGIAPNKSPGRPRSPSPSRPAGQCR